MIRAKSGITYVFDLWTLTYFTGTEGSKQEAECQQRRLAIQDTIIGNSGVGFDDVAGLEKAKQILKEAIIMPVQYPQLFTGIWICKRIC